MKISGFLLLSVLAALNFKANADAVVPVCARTAQVRVALERMFKQPCKDIKIEQLDEMDALMLDESGLVQLEESDFVGMNNLSILVLAKNPQLRFDLKILKPLTRLQVLDISQSGRKGFKPGYFDSLTSVVQLNLGGPELDYIPDDEFVMLPNLLRVDVSGAPLANTSKEAFRGVGTVSNLPATFGVDPGFDNKWP